MVPGRSTSRRRSADELELELLKLQDSTRNAVEKSWKEVNRMYEVNAEREAKIRVLQDQLDRKDKLDGIVQHSPHQVDLLRGSDVLRDEEDKSSSKTVLSEWEEDTLCDSSEFESQGPYLDEFSKQSNSESDADQKAELLENFSSHSRSSRKRSFLKPLFQMSEKSSTVAEELMGQMMTMQQFHAAELEESNLKLRQREAAIKTLERALSVQTKTVENLRKEIEFLEYNQTKRKESETKASSLRRTDSDLSSGATEAAKLPRRDRPVPTRSKSLIPTWPRKVKYSF